MNAVDRRTRIRANADARPLDSVVYQQAVDRLRARGCRCPLRFDGMTAVPLTPGDAAACGVHRQLPIED